jgi:hypothetical protein
VSLDKKEGSDLKNSRTPFNPKNKLVVSDSFNLYEKSMLNSFNLSTKVFLEKIEAPRPTLFSLADEKENIEFFGASSTDSH